MENSIYSFWAKIKSIINGESGRLAELAGFFVIGFLVGFLFKHIGKTVLLLTLYILGALWLLSYFNIIVINLNLLNSLGFNSAYIHSYAIEAINWVKSHIAESIGLAAGFISAKILA